KDPGSSYQILQLLEYYAIGGNISVVGPLSTLISSEEITSPLQRIFLTILDLSTTHDPRLKDVPDVRDDYDPKLLEHINAIIRDETLRFYFRRNALFLYAHYHTDEDLLKYVEELLDNPELCSSAATILIKNTHNLEIVKKKILDNNFMLDSRKKELLSDLIITQFS
ncbi:MAG TPA: hypothetical protein VFV86_07440, partial [Nitrososphaeraceae archaeon]|nr:hypothetical protein [Nitrososphaeraceae archaeon]